MFPCLFCLVFYAYRLLCPDMTYEIAQALIAGCLLTYLRSQSGSHFGAGTGRVRDTGRRTGRLADRKLCWPDGWLWQVSPLACQQESRDHSQRHANALLCFLWASQEVQTGPWSIFFVWLVLKFAVTNRSSARAFLRWSFAVARTRKSSLLTYWLTVQPYCPVLLSSLSVQSYCPRQGICRENVLMLLSESAGDSNK